MLYLDQNNKAFQLYHKSNKLLLPLWLCSFAYNRDDAIGKGLYSITNLVTGYHSYLSTSNVITDYIKPPRMSQCARVLNVNAHFAATCGFLYFIYK